MSTSKVDIKITRAKLVYEPNNNMVHNYYYLINFQVINPKTNTFFRMKMIEWFDVEEACEYYDKDSVTRKEIRELALYYAYNTIYAYISDYNERETLLRYCDESIENYNKIVDH